MNVKYFFSTFATLLLVTILVAAAAYPIFYQQLKQTFIELNLNKNREQAERLATLVSIDLEQGGSPEVILAKIQNMLESTPQSSEHFACVVEHENRVIAHPKPSNVGKDVSGWTLVNGELEKTYTQAAGEGVSFGGIQTRLDGSQDITFQVPISTKPWAVAVHTKLYLIDEQTQKVFVSIAWFIVLVLLFVSISASVLVGIKK